MAFLTAGIGAIGGSLGGASGIGTALSVVGTIFSGIASMQAGNYQAAVAERNAKIAEENANRSVLVSQEEARQNDMERSGQLGEMLSGQGASGLLTTGKSFMQTRRGLRSIARLESLNIRQAGEVEAYGHRVDALNQRSEGQFAKMKGQNAMIGSLLDAGSSLIGSSSGFSNGSSSVFARKQSYEKSGYRRGL